MDYHIVRLSAYILIYSYVHYKEPHIIEIINQIINAQKTIYLAFEYFFIYQSMCQSANDVCKARLCFMDEE